MGKTILIADDSSLARTIIKRCLEIAGLRGADFLEASDGKEALQKAKSAGIDLIVTDLNMPVMDGYALLKRVKTSPRLTKVPVVVVSSSSNAAKVKELEKMGAEAVLKKPVSPATFASALKDIINLE